MTAVNVCYDGDLVVPLYFDDESKAIEHIEKMRVREEKDGSDFRVFLGKDEFNVYIDRAEIWI